MHQPIDPDDVIRRMVRRLNRKFSEQLDAIDNFLSYAEAFMETRAGEGYHADATKALRTLRGEK